ncbi:MAG: cell wall-binding repeat-containing protein [Acidimicrobiia bacterium]
MLAASLVYARAAAPGPAPTRLAGSDRFATAASVSQSMFPPGVAVAYVATGTSFPDAFSAGPAAAHQGGPVLLVTRESVPASTASELARLRPARIVVVGGTGAVSDDVHRTLGPYTSGGVTRLSGADRSATAAAVSQAVFAPGPVVHVTSGADFADALAAGPVAVGSRGPVLLVGRDAIPTATAAELARLRPPAITVLGGTGAVSASVEAQLGAYAPVVGRVGGPDRFSTAANVSAAFFPGGAAKVFLATGYDFPDALGGGVVAGLAPGPVLFVRPDCTPVEVQAEIDRLGASSSVILGGPAAVGPGVEAGVVCAPPPPRATPTGWSPFAVAGPLTLVHPAARIERVGFHESNNDGAQQMEVLPTAVAPITLETRERGTGSRSAADVVVEPGSEIRSPVTGTVRRAGTYVLYCNYSDDYVVVEPDARPGWEVTVLHIDGVQVSSGDRVVAGQTVLAPAPTQLPFASQVDDHRTAEPAWPHVHIEVIDPGIPDRPGAGC